MQVNQTQQAVRHAYGQVATQNSGGGSPAQAGQTLSLGCGNPTALAELREGETVVDLGSGAGFDALQAALALGPSGRFIGVDMTPEMLGQARRNAMNAGFASTVEFREGLIEEMPVVSNSADVVISNCVINLSVDKPRVFRESFRVLKPGGRLAVSDIVLGAPLPADVAQLAATWVACIGGALTESDYLDAIRAAGFENVEFTRTPVAEMLDGIDDPLVNTAVQLLGHKKVAEIAKTVFSYSIRAAKPVL